MMDNVVNKSDKQVHAIQILRCMQGNSAFQSC